MYFFEFIEILVIWLVKLFTQEGLQWSADGRVPLVFSQKHFISENILWSFFRLLSKFLVFGTSYILFLETIYPFRNFSKVIIL